MNPRKAFEQALEEQKEEKEAVSPPGWEETVLKMKKHPEIDNPWALSYWMRGKGYTPGGKKEASNPRVAFEQALTQIQKQADNRDWTLARRQSYLYEEFLRQVKEELVGMEPEAGRKVKLSWIYRGQGFPRINAELVAADGSKKRVIFLPETLFQAASEILYQYGGY